MVEGVENFEDKVLFIASECQTVFGADWQKGQMASFPNAELAVIPDAGHEMFAENPEASIAVVREYLNTPASEERTPKSQISGRQHLNLIPVNCLEVK